jgi:hypothetical protein
MAALELAVALTSPANMTSTTSPGSRRTIKKIKIDMPTRVGNKSMIRPARNRITVGASVQPQEAGDRGWVR